jgi:hypothetical protein
MIRSKVKVKEAKIDRCCDEHAVNVNRNFLKAKLFLRIPVIISSMDWLKLLQNSNSNELLLILKNKILHYFHN